MAATFIEVSPTALSRRMPTVPGALILGIMAMTGILTVQAYLPDQDLPPTPPVVLHRALAQAAEPCVVGEVCTGPTVSARDPEGEKVTYRFYERLTKQLVGTPITVDSGKPVTPTFRFNEPGEKRLYLVVEDSAGHPAPNYPINIFVEDKK